MPSKSTFVVSWAIIGLIALLLCTALVLLGAAASEGTAKVQQTSTEPVPKYLPRFMVSQVCYKGLSMISINNVGFTYELDPKTGRLVPCK